MIFSRLVQSYFFRKQKKRPLWLVFFVFPIEFPGEHGPFSFHKLCADMHVNLTKFGKNSSLEYYDMTFIGKTKHSSLRGLFLA